MTVSELIEKLKDVPGDYEIQIQIPAYYRGDIEPENLPYDSICIAHDERVVLIFDHHCN